MFHLWNGLRLESFCIQVHTVISNDVFIWAAGFILRSTELVFSKLCGIFCTSCQVHSCCH